MKLHVCLIYHLVTLGIYLFTTALQNVQWEQGISWTHANLYSIAKVGFPTSNLCIVFVKIRIRRHRKDEVDGQREKRDDKYYGTITPPSRP